MVDGSSKALVVAPATRPVIHFEMKRLAGSHHSSKFKQQQKPYRTPLQ
jgi:hypothetical protein